MITDEPKKQAHCNMWYSQRSERVTASNTKAAMKTRPTKPVCLPHKENLLPKLLQVQH